ncbi:PepSY domain-containing protein [Microbulbifer marinus]|uniref:Peptidase propeptide and YPEB domain-containing protein n=1 Tax=Microbulbifer marinus TaxID=658218 RepID=A0A1H3WRR2_9GAMM|nr:PepSY domain-containing protein [Microbulbifer marinus]SDZ89835.1 Peptidase propeptide and YPEB domain-containing protein [Microbulbifer marinus]
MKLICAAFRPTQVVVVLLLGIFSLPLQAGVAYDREGFQPEYLRVQRKEISRDQAAAIVKRRYGGKILAISEVQKNGRSMYRVKGLSDKSQVYVVYVDKQSGRISR